MIDRASILLFGFTLMLMGIVVGAQIILLR
jgi:hypothetical protein